MDVRRLAAELTVGGFREWTRYFVARQQPAKAWIRDADQAEAVSAHLYGG